jgi:hypothetical protein
VLGNRILFLTLVIICECDLGINKGPVIKYDKGGGGDGGETRNFEKNVGPPLKNYMPFQGPPYALYTF